MRFRRAYPAPPRLHWLVLLVVLGGAEAAVFVFLHGLVRDLAVNLVFAAWPIYLSVWLRKIDTRSAALYWSVASLATGFLFAWLLWVVVVFEIREDLLEHYNQREAIGLKLHLVPTILFSFVYFQYHLRRIAQLKAQCPAPVVIEIQPTVSDWA